MGGGGFVVVGEEEGGVVVVEEADTALDLLEEVEGVSEGEAVCVRDVVVEAVLVLEEEAELETLGQPVGVFDSVADLESVPRGVGDRDVLAQPVEEGVAGILDDKDTDPVPLRDCTEEAESEGELNAERERAPEAEAEGELRSVGEKRDVAVAVGVVRKDAESAEEVDSVGEGALVRVTEAEPDTVFVPVVDGVSDAEPAGWLGGAPPLLGVGVNSAVRVDVTLADAVFVEDGEDVVEAVADALWEMLEQPLGDLEGCVERVDVVEGVARNEGEGDTDTVEVREGVEEGRGLRVVEDEGVTVLHSMGVLLEDGEGESEREEKLDKDALVDADVEGVAVSVTLADADAEGVLLEVDVLDDVCDTEGDVVRVPTSPASFSEEGDTEGVVVLLPVPEREGEAV